MKLSKKEKTLERCLKDRKGMIQEFRLRPAYGLTIIGKEGNRAEVLSGGDHLEYEGISEAAYGFLYHKYMP